MTIQKNLHPEGVPLHCEVKIKDKGTRCKGIVNYEGQDPFNIPEWKCMLCGHQYLPTEDRGRWISLHWEGILEFLARNGWRKTLKRFPLRAAELSQMVKDHEDFLKTLAIREKHKREKNNHLYGADVTTHTKPNQTPREIKPKEHLKEIDPPSPTPKAEHNHNEPSMTLLELLSTIKDFDKEVQIKALGLYERERFGNSNVSKTA